MRKDQGQAAVFDRYIHLLYLIFLASLIFSFRAVSSICIVVILFAEMIKNRPVLSFLLKKKYQNLFLVSCCILFLLQVIALIYTEDKQTGWTNVRIKTGLLITPLALCVSSFITAKTREKLLSAYCLLLASATLYCLCIAFVSYLEFEDPSLFFYHSLVKPIHQHAVYLSLLIMVGLVFLLENIPRGTTLFSGPLTISLALYLSVFLFLLSSKLVIFFYVAYLIIWFARFIQHNRTRKLVATVLPLVGLITITLVFITRNPISKRFYEIAKGDLAIIAQDSFSKGDYFNGLQFRLLQWKFVGEILNEQQGWLTGVGPGDAQKVLNEKYISKNLYSGEASRGDRGYLVYNTHNQFLQTVLQNGIIGLMLLLIICFSLVKMIFQHRNRPGAFIILLLLAWLFTEAAFETQYGIIIFTFFPLFFYNGNANLPLLQTGRDALRYPAILNPTMHQSDFNH